MNFQDLFLDSKEFTDEQSKMTADACAALGDNVFLKNAFDVAIKAAVLEALNLLHDREFETAYGHLVSAERLSDLYDVFKTMKEEKQKDGEEKKKKRDPRKIQY